MKRNRLIKIALYCATGVLLLIPLTGVGLWAWNKPTFDAIKRYDCGFNTIVRGMSQADVVKLMGEPDNIRSGKDVIMARSRWDGVPDEAGSPVQVEYNYHVDTFFLPIDWLIGFSGDQKVVSKHRRD